MAFPVVLWESRPFRRVPHQERRTVTFISILKVLWKRRLLVALAIVIAVAVAVVAVYQVSLHPPGVSKRSTPSATGSSEVLIDSARSPIAGSKRNVEALSTRAAVFARLMASGHIVKEIAKETGVLPWEIQVTGPMPFPGEAPGISEAGEKLPYGLTYTQIGELPIISISSRAPTAPEARALAAAAPRSLEKMVTQVQKQQKTPARERVEIRVLGPAQVSASDSGPGNKLALAAFFGILLVEIGLILGLPRLVTAWRRVDDEDNLEDVADISEPKPTLVIPHAGVHGERHDQVRQG
jgi:capsular polysaccharide biosynthesis protein